MTLMLTRLRSKILHPHRARHRLSRLPRKHSLRSALDVTLWLLPSDMLHPFRFLIWYASGAELASFAAPLVSVDSNANGGVATFSR